MNHPHYTPVGVDLRDFVGGRTRLHSAWSPWKVFAHPHASSPACTPTPFPAFPHAGPAPCGGDRHRYGSR